MEKYMNHQINYPEDYLDETKITKNKKKYIDNIRRAIEIDESREVPLLTTELISVLQNVLDPTLIDRKGKCAVILTCFSIRLLIPGTTFSWESIYHLEYLMLCVIRQSETYEILYDIKKETQIRIMMNKFNNKNLLVGLACQIRDSKNNNPSNRVLNAICHCNRSIEDTPSRIRNTKDDKYYKEEWDTEHLKEAKDHIIEILENNQHLLPLLEDGKAAKYIHRVDILYKIMMASIKITDHNAKKLMKIEGDILSCGGTIDYIQQHNIEFMLHCIVGEVKWKLYDELIEKLDNNTGKIKKSLRKGINTIKNKLNKLITERADLRINMIRGEPKLSLIKCIREIT